MENRNVKRGFAGFIDLVSAIQIDLTQHQIERTAPNKPPTQSRSKVSSSSEISDPVNKQSKNPETPTNIDNKKRQGLIWVLCAIIIIFISVIGLNNIEIKKYDNTVHDPQAIAPQYAQPSASNTDSDKVDAKEKKRKQNKSRMVDNTNSSPINNQQSREIYDNQASVPSFDEFINRNENQSDDTAPFSRRTLSREIEEGKILATQLEIRIKNMDTQLNDYKRRLQYYQDNELIDDYNILVPTYNSLVAKRNGIYEEYSQLIDEINVKVRQYNSRLK